MTQHVFEVDIHTAHEMLKNGEAVMIDARMRGKNFSSTVRPAGARPKSQNGVYSQGSKPTTSRVASSPGMMPAT